MYFQHCWKPFFLFAERSEEKFDLTFKGKDLKLIEQKRREDYPLPGDVCKWFFLFRRGRGGESECGSWDTLYIRIMEENVSGVVLLPFSGFFHQKFCVRFYYKASLIFMIFLFAHIAFYYFSRRTGGHTQVPRERVPPGSFQITGERSELSARRGKVSPSYVNDL